MGFFSWDCKSCGHPALGDMAINNVNQWMNVVVALFPDGSRMIGEYDGYGRVNGVDIYEYDDNVVELWHKACWIKAGKPEYSAPSDRSADQGWFFNEGTHDMKEPIPD